ncbi:CLUMA_CG019394, isoform A [Clunio marinus]|uniref:CLUMA_CG019394, isoform A n=1 Tax=Clunio marinus TaxID=568069 RepID=A0A1J1J1P5_9DIPT|nr:CLUMA_CG019394, isoform A [Clunio marinus]
MVEICLRNSQHNFRSIHGVWPLIYSKCDTFYFVMMLRSTLMGESDKLPYENDLTKTTNDK